MDTAVKKLVAILVVVTILSVASLANKEAVSAYEDNLRIDLYTQKEPYSGRGLNQPGDAFTPQEDVQLYAYVTYCDDPVEGKLVAFQVSDPLGNAVLFRSSVTNAWGIASITFRIPNEPMFGQWTAFAAVEVTGRNVNDTLTFKVGWIVELISIRTFNQNNITQDIFARGSLVGVEIGLRNIAMSQRTAYLTITIFDQFKNPINSTAIDNFVVPPNDIPCYTYVFLYIPLNAVRGDATIYVGAYTGPISSHGVPYCPEISKHITIVGQTFFLNVETDPPDIVIIPGEGWYEEGTYVNLTAPNYVNVSADMRYRFAYWDIDGVPSFGNLVSVLIDGNHNATAHFIAQYLLTFTQMGLDSSASGTILTVGDVPKTFNDLPFCFWVDHSTTVTYHYNDVIATDISGKRFNLTEIVGSPSPLLVTNVTTIVGKYRIQYYLTIKTAPSRIATVEGEGWYYESTQVTISAPIVPNYKFQHWDVDGVLQGSGINPITIQMNAPHILTAHYAQIPTYTLTIIATEGGTTEPSPGTYSYKEGYPADVRAIPKTGYIFSHWELDGINIGSITIIKVIMNDNHVLKAVFSAAPRGWFIPSWFFLPLLLILVLIIIVIAIFLYRRTRKRKMEAFNSGWVAWYYHHNLYRRTLK